MYRSMVQPKLKAELTLMVLHLAEQKVQRKAPTKCLAEKRVVQKLMVQWKVHLKVASLDEQKVQRKVPKKCLAEKRVVQKLMVVRLACLTHLAHPMVPRARRRRKTI